MPVESIVFYSIVVTQPIEGDQERGTMNTTTNYRVTLSIKLKKILYRLLFRAYLYTASSNYQIIFVFVCNDTF